MEAMRCLRVLLSLGLCLAAGVAFAEPDAFLLGNGQHGALRVQQLDTVINLATALTAPANSDGKTLAVMDSAGFAAGELVLVLQVSSEGPVPEAGTAGPVELDTSSGAGRWEFARLESVGTGVLNLTAPLVSAFSFPGTQVVRVPEYISVHVLPSASLMAPPWNGSSGGVLAFLATDFVLNQGVISADNAGFRGGVFAVTATRVTGCTELNQSEATGGAQKGEGVFSAVAAAPTHGYGALGNGAGGGNCEDGGGGGGGHGGVGGKGGFTTSTDGARDVGGRGGLALRYSPLKRMVFGGGGGAGAGNTPTGGGKGGTSGGAGGGIISIRARDFQGSQGVIHANGGTAADSASDGAGGGGAGGHITLRVEGRIDCAGVEARGGGGGNNTAPEPHGPGGGGAGGVVVLQGEMITCASAVVAGAGGLASAAIDGGAYGATPSAEQQAENQGTTTSVPERFALPTVPTWVAPAEGETTGPQPQLQGTAQPGSTLTVLLNGQLLGSAVTADDGTFTLQPPQELPLGPYEVRASAERLGLRSAFSEPRAFTVGTLSPSAFQVGCGCGATSTSGGGAFLLLGGLLAGLSWRRAGRLPAGRAALAGQGCPGVHLPVKDLAGLPGSRGTAERAGTRR
jgi:hypothetical protein